jgi:hypothetical protein
MTMKALRRMICIFLLSLSFAGGLLAHDLNDSPKESILQACKVARDKFQIKLNADKKYEWEYRDYVTDIANYGMGVSEGKDAYFVFFKLKKVENILGGGTLYVIDKKTLKIVSETHFK